MIDFFFFLRMAQNSLVTRKPVALGFLIKLIFGCVHFCRGRKTGEPRKKPWSKDENQQQIQRTHDGVSGDQTGAHWQEASALTIAPALLSQSNSGIHRGYFMSALRYEISL